MDLIERKDSFYEQLLTTYFTTHEVKEILSIQRKFRQFSPAQEPHFPIPFEIGQFSAYCGHKKEAPYFILIKSSSTS